MPRTTPDCSSTAGREIQLGCFPANQKLPEAIHQVGKNNSKTIVRLQRFLLGKRQ
jgi:hypothetical protein